MKTIALAGVAILCAVMGNARAADLPIKAPPAAPAAFNWSGFYAGANVGYGWGRTGGDLVDATTGLGIPAAITGGTIPSSYGLRERGVIGGGQIGHNWRTSNWVWGLEADFQGSGIAQSVAFSHPAVFVFGGLPFLLATESAGSASLDWFGTVRARLGYASDRALIYGTGGLAYGRVSEFVFNHVLVPPPSGAFSASEFRLGWTLGAGAEWAFANAWSVKAEYLHVDLGPSTGRTHPGPNDFLEYRFQHAYEVARVGINYHWADGPISARY